MKEQTAIKKRKKETRKNTQPRTESNRRTEKN